MAPRSLAVVSALVAAAGAAGAAAQSTVVTSMYLYGAEGTNVVASVVAATPQATTYVVACADGTDSSECGFGPGVTYVQGPATFGAHVTASDSLTYDVDCAITSATAACVETNAGPAANSPGTTSTTVTDMSRSMLPVTVTAGVQLLALAAGGNGTAATNMTATAGANANSNGTLTGGASVTGASSNGTDGALTAIATSTSTVPAAAGSTDASGSAPKDNAAAGVRTHGREGVALGLVVVGLVGAALAV